MSYHECAMQIIDIKKTVIIDNAYICKGMSFVSKRGVNQKSEQRPKKLLRFVELTICYI